MLQPIDAAEFEALFACPPGTLPVAAREQLARTDTAHEDAGVADLEEYILHFLQQIDSPLLQRSREENLAAFEKGWGENFQRLRTKGISLDALKPGYFRGCRFLRYRGRLVTSPNLQLEFDLFRVARLVLFHRYLRDIPAIWELGCGSCQNILMLAEQFPDSTLVASDWTAVSGEIADHLGRELKRDIHGVRYDMAGAPIPPPLAPGGAIVTIHAFEQLGTDFHAVLQTMLAAQPAIVLQYEPVLEFYDPSNLYDGLALRYCRKRRYLDGYYTELRRLEAAGRIEILEARRPFLGGTLHEASVLAWRPRPAAPAPQ